MGKRILAIIVLILFICLLINLFTIRLFPVFSISVYAGVMIYYIFVMGKKNT